MSLLAAHPKAVVTEIVEATTMPLSPDESVYSESDVVYRVKENLKIVGSRIAFTTHSKAFSRAVPINGLE